MSRGDDIQNSNSISCVCCDVICDVKEHHRWYVFENKVIRNI
jgi:hypothetical protein